MHLRCALLGLHTDHCLASVYVLDGTSLEMVFFNKMPEHPGICSNHLKMLVGHLMIM